MWHMRLRILLRQTPVFLRVPPDYTRRSAYVLYVVQSLHTYAVHRIRRCTSWLTVAHFIFYDHFNSYWFFCVCVCAAVAPINVGPRESHVCACMCVWTNGGNIVYLCCTHARTHYTTILLGDCVCDTRKFVLERCAYNL